jgi:hypothetical protein
MYGLQGMGLVGGMNPVLGAEGAMAGAGGIGTMPSMPLMDPSGGMGPLAEFGATGTMPTMPMMDPTGGMNPLTEFGVETMGPIAPMDPTGGMTPLPEYPQIPTVPNINTGGTPNVPGGGNGGGGNTGNGNFDIASLLQLLGGISDLDAGDRSTDTILEWLNGQQSYIDGLYAPGSDEYNALWDQMSRTDAAAGRNSQYGPRSVDLAARLAETKGNLRTKLATGVADVYSSSINRENSSHSGLTSALGNLFGGSNSAQTNQLFNSILSLFGGSSGSNNNSWIGTSLADHFLGNGTGGD